MMNAEDLPPLPDDFRVPDYMGMFEGWRLWRVRDADDGASLLSFFNETRWPPREKLCATCAVTSHSAPVQACSCGIYARARFEQYVFKGDAFFRPREPMLVVGVVHLWGRTIRHTHGFRAQYVYPKNLYVVHLFGDRRDAEMKAASLVEVYGAPCETAPRWRFL